ncbi:sporulation protein [Hugenholtzia roseola]|uniref:sporulation protein n=1 Tax=Hugenholtzia roseola TaxID=1002 RepID=UPI00040A7B20|nr:sporulation protein [Hugenholtzia roseola]
MNFHFQKAYHWLQPIQKVWEWVLKPILYLLHHLLSQFGVGSLKLNARMERISLLPCETLKGDLFIYGGKVSEKINKVSISLMVTLKNESKESSKALAHYTVAQNLKTQAGRNQIVPFSFLLPPDLPPTSPDSKIWLKTRATLAHNFFSPQDYDELEILPNPLMLRIEEALFSLGFKITGRTQVEPDALLAANLPLVEKMSYRNLGRLSHLIQDAEVVMLPQFESLDIFVEVNRYQNKGKTKKGIFSLSKAEVEDLESLLFVLEKKLLQLLGID